jgi:signal transduction histidine kinase
LFRINYSCKYLIYCLILAVQIPKQVLKKTKYLTYFFRSNWSNVVLVFIGTLVSLLILQAHKSKFRASSYQDIFRINEIFQEYTQFINVFPKLIEEDSDPEKVLKLLLETNNIFQVRLVDKAGLELVKFDKYGFDNKNSLLSRPYWDAVTMIDTDRWFVSKAEKNIENDQFTGHEVITGNTIRYFYRFPNRLNLADSIGVDYLAVNLDFNQLTRQLDSLFPEQEIIIFDDLISQNEPREYFSNLNWVADVPLRITFDGARWTIFGLRFSYSLFPTISLSLFAFLFLYGIKRAALASLNNLAKEEQISNQRKFITSWVNMASHHFRHPLANINTRLDIIRLKGLSPDSKDIDQIQHSFTEFLSVFEYLKKLQVLSELDFRNKEWYRLGELNKKLSEIESNAIDILKLPLAFEQYQIFVDPLPFEWAIVELVDNSIRHSQGSKVAVSMNHSNRAITIIVTDNGKGLSKKVLSMLNTEQNDKLVKGFETGSFGLGLYQLVKIVDHHNFSITAENISTGGCRVGIEIPHELFLKN